MNRSEWEQKVIDESYKLDQYLKKSPPVLSEELKQTYTKLLDECEKALRRFEIEIRVHPFGGDSFLKSLCKDIEKLILKIKDYLYLYRTWKPKPPAAPAPAKSPVAPPATKPIVPAPVTPATKKNEEEPKTGFFTPTNILLVLLVVGGGFFFLTRKEK